MRQPTFFVKLLCNDPYIGNIELADRYAVTFLAASATPEEEWAKVEKWLETEIYGTDKVVVSGFHSPFEKRVLESLLARNHPAIIYLARSIYKRMPPEYEVALAENRLLIISYYPKCSRVSYRHSEDRNAGLMTMTDEVVTIGVTHESIISTLFDLLGRSATKPFRKL